MDILILDDEEVIRDSLSSLLKQKGYVCHTASLAEEAMEMIEDLPKISIVISDIQMPGMTGIELLKHITSKYASIKVLMLTGYADLESAIDAVNFGADAFFRKPLDINDLLSTIEDIVMEKEKSAIREVPNEVWVEEYKKLHKAYEALTVEISHLLK